MPRRSENDEQQPNDQHKPAHEPLKKDPEKFKAASLAVRREFRLNEAVKRRELILAPQDRPIGLARLVVSQIDIVGRQRLPLVHNVHDGEVFIDHLQALAEVQLDELTDRKYDEAELRIVEAAVDACLEEWMIRVADRVGRPEQERRGRPKAVAMPELQTRLVEYLERANETYVQFGARAGVTERTIGKIVGTGEASTATWLSIEAALYSVENPESIE